MKKTNKLFFTMCMVGGFAVLFGSCKKNEEVASTTVNLPAFEEEVDGRAYIDFEDGKKFKWNDNDQIVVYNLDNQDGTQSEKAIYQTGAVAGQTVAKFEYFSGQQITAKKYGYFVFYPADKVSDANLNSDNYETFTVSETQQYTKVGTMPTVDPAGMAMAIDINSLNGAYYLKHIFGVLRLRLQGTGNVDYIEVEDARFNLSGTVSMKLHEVKMNKFSSLESAYAANDDPYNYPTFINAWNEYRALLNYTTNGTGHTMTLQCYGVGLSDTAETPFYIGLRPGALKYGFTVRVYLQGETTPRTFDYTGANNLHYGIKAGKVKGLSLAIQ